MEVNLIYNEDCLTGLSKLSDNSVDCCVTSPPYYGLRDYGNEAQIGLEETPDAFIDKLVAVFAEVRRVLKPEGTCWVNMGDSYANDGKWGGASSGKNIASQHGYVRRKVSTGLKPKDLIGIPWMLAFALRRDGWYLRQDIVWSKPNPMPESVTDRCTKSHEYIFMLTKSARYFYDAGAIRTDRKTDISEQKYAWGRAIDGSISDSRKGNGKEIQNDKQRGHSRRHAGFNDRWDAMTVKEQQSMGANKRSVWSVATKPFSEAHFATFPPDLIVPCIKAGCPVDGVVLDPFMGAGTTALVARKLDRKYIGFELNLEYIAIAQRRLRHELGMFH